MRCVIGSCSIANTLSFASVLEAQVDQGPLRGGKAIKSHRKFRKKTANALIFGDKSEPTVTG